MWCGGGTLYWIISTHVHLLPRDYKSLPNEDQAISVLEQKLPLNSSELGGRGEMKAHVI